MRLPPFLPPTPPDRTPRPLDLRERLRWNVNDVAAHRTWLMATRRIERLLFLMSWLFVCLATGWWFNAVSRGPESDPVLVLAYGALVAVHGFNVVENFRAMRDSNRLIALLDDVQERCEALLAAEVLP